MIFMDIGEFEEFEEGNKKCIPEGQSAEPRIFGNWRLDL